MDRQSVEIDFFRLPVHDVVFPHIFSHLGVLEVWCCRAVCRMFLAVCNEFFRVSPTLDLRPYQLQLQRHGGTFVRILQASEQLQRFYLRGINCSSVLPATLADQHQALVNALVSRGNPAPPSPLRVLSLENVDLHQLHRCMRELARHCAHLEELTLSSVVPFDDESLELVSGECRSLERLTLRNLPVRGHSLLKLASRCPSLKHLTVSYCSYVRSAHLEETLKTCSQLQSIDLRYLHIANDRIVLVIAEFCPGIRSLKVEGCSSVTERTLTPLRQRGVIIDVAYQVEQNLRVPGQI